MLNINKLFLILYMFSTVGMSNAQVIDSLNTAQNCRYMSPLEKEMIYQINLVRSKPASFLQYLTPLLTKAKNRLKINGKGNKNYSLTISETSRNGKNPGTIDTTWNYENEEEVRALTTLISDLKKLKKLSTLQPDSGIYHAAKNYAADEQAHDWKLLHTGSDGSDPLQRILYFSPTMVYGNENIGGCYGYGCDTPRDLVLQLLIDAGIPGYGHRYNVLDPQWTHVACSIEKFKGETWWIQDFGAKKKVSKK